MTNLASIRHIIRMTLVLMALSISATASAVTLQEAMSQIGAVKAQGLIGERPNGYLGVVRDEQNARQIADLINDARRAEYARIAEQNNIAVSDVEAMAGKRAIERTPPGQYIEIDDQWVVKR